MVKACATPTGFNLAFVGAAFGAVQLVAPAVQGAVIIRGIAILGGAWKGAARFVSVGTIVE